MLIYKKLVLEPQFYVYWMCSLSQCSGLVHYILFYVSLCGLVIILHILLSICHFHGTSERSVMIYCDCKSAINKLPKKQTYGSIKDYLVPDYDLLHEG